MKIRVLGLSLLVLCTMAAPAQADIERIDDGDSTRGPLDIRWVRQGHDYRAKIRYSISTFENYSARDLRRGRFVFRFDIDADDGFERSLAVHWRDFEKTDGGKLVAPMKNSKRKIVGHPGTAHWSGNRLRVWIARKHLENPSRYRVAISSKWPRRPCRERTCTDEIPVLTHRLWPLCYGTDPTIVGTSGNDTIQGTSDRDVIYAGSGDDRVDTNGGWDQVCGGAGNDHIVGSKRPDRFDGGVGDDHLAGRGATYMCNDTPGSPESSGPPADCAFPVNELEGGVGNDEVIGGPDVDWLWGGDGDDAMFGRDGRDRLRGGNGHDVLDGGKSYDGCHNGEVKQRC
jgi:hypothetical protein